MNLAFYSLAKRFNIYAFLSSIEERHSLEPSFLSVSVLFSSLHRLMYLPKYVPTYYILVHLHTISYQVYRIVKTFEQTKTIWMNDDEYDDGRHSPA